MLACLIGVGSAAARAISANQPRASSKRRKGRRRVRLHVRRPLAPVEDVVRREVDERRAELGGVRGAADVHGRGPLRVVLGAVHVRPGRGVQHEAELRVVQLGRRGMLDVPGGPVERDGARKGFLQRLAELAAAARDYDASRSERIGDDVLQSPATRGSFQGSSCSSGSAGSYSSVTW